MTTVVRTNLVPNPSATVNTTGWAVSGTSLTRDTTVSRSGGASFKIVTAFGGMDSPAGTAGIPVTPGVTYRFSFWAKGNSNNEYATFQNTWYDSAGVSISSANPSYTQMSSGGWTLVAPANPTGLYTAPANAAYLQLRPRTNGNGVTFWIDDILVEAVTPGLGTVWPVYFDGDTTDTADEIFAWTGTANASASTATFTGRTNMVANPSYEVDGAGYTTSISTGTSTATAIVSGLSYAQGTTAETLKVAATAGQDYTGSAWLHRSATARSGAVSVHFFNTAGTELDAPTVTLVAIPTQLTPTLYSSTRTAPAGTTQVAVRITASATISWDAVLLEQASSVGTYFDGSTTPPAGYYTYWTGQPHFSQSRLSVTPPPPRTNMFTHPSAEGAGITWTAAVGTPTAARSTEAARTGTESYKMTADATGGAMEIITPTGTAAFPVTGGNFYSASAYSGRQGSTGVRSITMKIAWYTSAGALISTFSGTTVTEASGTSLSWTRASAHAQAPVAAAFAAVQMRWASTVAGEVHYLDDILLEQTPYLLPYFSGSTVQAGYSYAWTGAANASSSTQTGVTDPVVTFKHYESGSWVTRTAKSKAWNGSAWVGRRPKRWTSSAWVDLN